MINTIHLTISALEDDRELVSSGFPADEPPRSITKYSKESLWSYSIRSLSALLPLKWETTTYRLVLTCMCSPQFT